MATAASSVVTLEKKKRTRSFRSCSLSSSSTSKKPCTRCELVGFDSLPEYLKDNEFLLNYYRADWPLKETMLSIFSIHNETLNIWTHLIGFFIFLCITVCAATTIRWHDGAGSSVAEQPVARWPFFAFLAGAMLCLLSSSACHLVSCHSERCAYAMLRLDYAGISTLIVTSFYPLVYYTFLCDPFSRGLYLGLITALGAAAVLASLVPAFQTPACRPARALLFSLMAASGLVPIAHKVAAFGDRPEAIATAWYELAMGTFYGLGVAAYVARVPERWMPGRFDIVGHSHQLFHVLVIAGAYTHYLAGLEYLKWRDVQGPYCQC
ncbi:heptahelical transmembrane protein 4-like [Iris pallida]|uniref:Heptahelical transmembrane protein 4-like n=1 Tax=Iris pallida TaxID=29817 RepID=A0AAX6FI26_IRIPA|nr:heptahelical transmembrane protein 4-like [Iris pallida]